MTSFHKDESGMQMPWQYCSEQEGELRNRIHDVHAFEATMETNTMNSSKRVIDPFLAVRRFVRPGSEDLHRSHPRRSVKQLQVTVEYLKKLWMKEKPKPELQNDTSRESSHHTVTTGAAAYTFVMDRLAAVRQELALISEDKRAHIASNTVRTGTEMHFEDIMCIYFDISDLYVRMEADTLPLPHQYEWLNHILHEQHMNSCVTSALSIPPPCDVHNGFEEHNSSWEEHAVSKCSPQLTSIASKEKYQRTELQILQVALMIRSHVLKSTAIFVSTGEDTTDSPTSLLRYFANIPNMTFPHLCIPPLASNVLEWKQIMSLIGHFRNSNPAGAIKILRALRTQHKQQYAVALQPLAAICCLWRLLLCDACANKGEKVPLFDICRRLYVDNSVDSGSVRSSPDRILSAATRALSWPEHIIATSTPAETTTIPSPTPAQYCCVLKTKVITVAEASSALMHLRML